MSEAPDNGKRFIKILLQNKLVSQEKLEECRQLQQRYPDKSLGQILVAKKYLSPENRNKIVKALGGAAGGGGGGGGGDGGKPKPKPKPKAAPAVADGDILGEKEGFTGDAAKDMQALLKKAAEMEVSDLHINVNGPPKVRHNGQLYQLNMPKLPPEMTEKMMYSLLSPAELEEFKEKLDLDFTYEIEGVGRFRSNIFKQQQGIDGAFRFIPHRVRTLEELGVPLRVKDMTDYTQGLTLITGPAGSGKTTTLAALVQLIRDARKENIICLEEPIEYIIPSGNSNVFQRQIPRDSLSFGNALRASLREDPDVIMIGEMRDKDTVSVAVTAAETGHLVLGSLHTSSAARTVDRVLDVFPPREAAQVRAMISESLRGVLSQQLVPRADGNGRVVACEIMFNTLAIGNLIRDSRTFQIRGVLQTQKKAGMQTMDDALKQLVKEGTITKEVARSRAEKPSDFD